MGICGLCGQNKTLKISHIIPSFATRWIKETGVTGFLRGLKTPNKREQDPGKEKFLCGDCEEIFSKTETKFSKHIFHPYINEELDDNYVARGEIKYFEYSEYLLKFIISVNWRILTKNMSSYFPIAPKVERKNLFEATLGSWRDYLLGHTKTPGKAASYLIFLQNLSAAYETFSEAPPSNLNFYLLRSNDGTILESIMASGVYTKLGPMICYSAISPTVAAGMEDARVRKSGVIKTAQHSKNVALNKYFYFTRPKEMQSLTKISPKQAKSIKETYIKNQHKWAGTCSKIAFEADLILKNKLSTFKSGE